MAKIAAIFPAWVQTLDAMIDEGARVRMTCTVCAAFADVDLVALREQVGGSYSLINRRCQCRLTQGCTGWNRPRYLHGLFRPLWDERLDKRS